MARYDMSTTRSRTKKQKPIGRLHIIIDYLLPNRLLRMTHATFPATLNSMRNIMLAIRPALVVPVLNPASLRIFGP
jgi:hypothetical protein